MSELSPVAYFEILIIFLVTIKLAFKSLTVETGFLRNLSPVLSISLYYLLKLSKARLLSRPQQGVLDLESSLP